MYRLQGQLMSALWGELGMPNAFPQAVIAISELHQGTTRKLYTCTVGLKNIGHTFIRS